jgi:hypothetical protein
MILLIITGALLIFYYICIFTALLTGTYDNKYDFHYDLIPFGKFFREYNDLV